MTDDKLQAYIDKIQKRFANITTEEVKAFQDEADSLHYVTFPSGDLEGVWLCHCLELDIIGQSRVGRGPTNALEHTIDMAYTTLVCLNAEGRNRHDEVASPEWWPKELLAEYKRRHEEGLKIVNAMEQKKES
jgi:hypothetical protein